MNCLKLIELLILLNITFNKCNKPKLLHEAYN